MLNEINFAVSDQWVNFCCSLFSLTVVTELSFLYSTPLHVFICCHLIIYLRMIICCCLLKLCPFKIIIWKYARLQSYFDITSVYSHMLKLCPFTVTCWDYASLQSYVETNVQMQSYIEIVSLLQLFVELWLFTVIC